MKHNEKIKFEMLEQFYDDSFCLVFYQKAFSNFDLDESYTLVKRFIDKKYDVALYYQLYNELEINSEPIATAELLIIIQPYIEDNFAEIIRLAKKNKNNCVYIREMKEDKIEKKQFVDLARRSGVKIIFEKDIKKNE